ncbi:MAG: class I SAM-dependent methyltransferase, partial [bacterium]|nr:class I SAM-dependent methyltransferase [bacterium]
FLKLKIKNANILDVGCGEGHLLERLQKAKKDNKYYGIDVIPLAINQAKERCPFANIEMGDIYETKYSNEFFDVVVCTEVLEHIFDFKLALKEMERILKPGGVLIITFPNEVLWTISRFFLGRRPIKVPDHVNSFSPDNIKKNLSIGVVTEKGLPFGMPFLISLGYLMVFKKQG